MIDAVNSIPAEKAPTEKGYPLSLVLIQLMKGVLYGDENEQLWQHLLALQAQVRDYVRVLGLNLTVVEDEGVAWLTTRSTEDGEPELPRLVNKRQLSYPVSLLLALLRRKLAEHDASSSEQRLILDKEDLIEHLRVFLPASTNDVRFVDQIDSHLTKIVEIGFIRRLRNDNSRFEVRRILKAFVDAQWLHELDQRLAQYVQKFNLTQEAV